MVIWNDKQITDFTKLMIVLVLHVAGCACGMFPIVGRMYDDEDSNNLESDVELS